LIEAVGGEAGVEKPAGPISGCGTRFVAKNEEKFCDRWIFKYGFQVKCRSRKDEFRGAGNRLVIAGADERGERDGLMGRIGNPSGDNAKTEIGLVPLESVETGDGGRVRILDAKSEARLAADHVKVQSTAGEMRRKLILVRFRSQSLRFCRRSSDEKVRRESSRGRIQRNDFGFEVKDGEMGWSGREMDFVVKRGADGIVAGLEPFQADER